MTYERDIYVRHSKSRLNLCLLEIKKNAQKGNVDVALQLLKANFGDLYQSKKILKNSLLSIKFIDFIKAGDIA